MSDLLLGRALTVAGVAAVGLGVVVMTVPGAAGLVGASEAFVAILGVIALVQTARTAGDIWDAPRARADLPDGHRIDSAHVQGATIDRALERSGRRGAVGRRNRERLARSLRDAAATILAAETGEPDDVVRTRLDEGTWTGDPVAAALFADEYEPTVRDAVRSLLGRETSYQRRVRRAVAALEAIAEEGADG